MTSGRWAKGPHARPRLTGRKWQELKRRLLSANPLCVACQQRGRVRLAVHLDHITPHSKGGSDDPSNLQGLCEECHRIKSNADRGYRTPPTIGADGYPVE